MTAFGGKPTQYHSHTTQKPQGTDNTLKNVDPVSKVLVIAFL